LRTTLTEFVRVLEKRQGFKICCPEEIAFHLGWINAGQLEGLGKPIAKSAYGQYLLRVAQG
jgi:glucose-1-phosphate thymidylyltransferase